MALDDGALSPGLAVNILADIAQEFSSLEDWQARVKRALSLICRALHSGTAAVAVRLEGWHNFFCPGFQEDENICTTMRQHYSILSGTELFLSEAVEEADLSRPPGSIISLPVTGADRVLGVLHLSAEEIDAYSLQDVSLLSVMASQLGSYLVNVLSHQQEVEARHKLMQAHDELGESRKRLAKAQEIARLGDWRWVFATGEITYSEELFRVLGIAPDTFTHRFEAFLDLVVPEDRKTLKKQIEEAIQRKEHFQIEYRIRRPDERIIHVWVLGEVETDEQGNPVCMIGTLQDITERKQMEEELRQARKEAEQRAAELESIFTSMPDGVALFSAQGDPVYLNQAGVDISGIPADASLRDLITQVKLYTLEGVPVPYEQSPWARSLRGETIREERYAAFSPWITSMFSVSSAPETDTRGKIIGATVVFRDVREQVELEQQREEMLKREHKIAETLQKALVPPETIIQIQGCSIALVYEPGLKEAEVGGDFYDVFELHEDKIGILIGDVVGKGLPAAISVAASRYTIRSYAYSEPSPGNVLAMANDAVIRGQQGVANMFTAFYAVLDTRTGEMVYANGGHEPPVVCDVEGNTEELHLKGRMLGVMTNYEYAQDTRSLKPGDKVVIVTDGIPDARSGDIFFDMTGVVQYVREHHKASPKELASGLLHSAKEIAGGNLQDDAAIVVIEYSAPDSG